MMAHQKLTDKYFDHTTMSRHRPQASDGEIQEWVEKHYGFRPECTWISHCKELAGIPQPGKLIFSRKKTCPPDKQAAVQMAFRHFGRFSLD
jgi:hypothetical protein